MYALPAPVLTDQGTDAMHGASPQVGADAWAQMHDGHQALLRPEEPRSEIYESVWRAAQEQQRLQPVAQPATGYALPPSSEIPTLTILTSPRRRETASFPTIAHGHVAAAAVADVAQHMRLWTPEQIEAFARGLVRG